MKSHILSKWTLLAVYFFCNTTGFATTTTWTTPHTVSGIIVNTGDKLIINGTTVHSSNTIIVSPGGELDIINSSTLSFTSSGASIEVQTDPSLVDIGGILDVESSIITVSSGVRFSGIDVVGVTNQSQYTNYPARATFNNSTIEGMQFGINNYDRFMSVGTTVNQYGGIIKAYNSTFHNNQLTLDMENYHNTYSGRPSTDRSIFQLCNFVWDGSSVGTGSVHTNFVYLFNVDGIQFQGCSFSDAFSYAHTLDQIAVNEVIAGASFMDYCSVAYLTSCPSPTHTTFSGFNYCIQAFGSGTISQNYIRNVQMSNCTVGVYLTGYGNPVVTGNVINIVRPTTTTSLPAIGISMEGCSSYTLAGNTVTCTNPGSTSAGATTNELAYGIIITNSGPGYNQAYQNTLINCNYSIQANGKNRNNDTLTNGLVLLCNNMHNNTVGDALDITAYPAPITATSDPSQGIAFFQGYYSGYTGIASGNVFATKSGSPLYNHIDYNDDNSIIYSYYASGANQTPIYYNTPAVSITAQANNTCPNWAVPLVGRSNKIIATTPYYARISGLVSQKSGCTFVPGPGGVNACNFFYPSYQTLTDTLNNGFLFGDTIYTNYDSIAYVLQHARVEYNYQIWAASLYAQMNNYATAFSILNSISTNYSLSADAFADIQSIDTLIIVSDTLYHNGHDWGGLDSAYIKAVERMGVSPTGYSGHWARAYLSTYEGKQYIPIFNVASSSGNKWAISVSNNNINDKIVIYPNPVDENINIDLPDYKGDIGLRIIDVTGKVQFMHPLSPGSNQVTLHLIRGIYFAQVTLNGLPVKTVKLLKN